MVRMLVEMMKAEWKEVVKDFKAEQNLSNEERALVKAGLIMDMEEIRGKMELANSIPEFDDVPAEIKAEQIEFCNDILAELKSIVIEGEADMNLEEIAFNLAIVEDEESIKEVVTNLVDAFNAGNITEKEYDQCVENLHKMVDEIEMSAIEAINDGNYAPTPESAKKANLFRLNVQELVNSL